MFGKKKKEEVQTNKLRPIHIYRAKCIGTYEHKSGVGEPRPLGYGKNPCGWHYFTSLELLPITDPDNSDVACVQCGGELVGLTLAITVEAKTEKEALNITTAMRTKVDVSMQLVVIAGLLREVLDRVEGLVDWNPLSVLGVSAESEYIPDGPPTYTDAFCPPENEDDEDD